MSEWQALDAAAVAICTERVEAKAPCGVGVCWLRCVAICTERVEAKVRGAWIEIVMAIVAICTERVEAKIECCAGEIGDCQLQSARSVWRQRLISPP